MPIRRLVVRTVVAVTAAGSLLGPSAALAAPVPVAMPGTGTVALAGILPPHNPSRSLPPRPNFLRVRACSTAKNGAYCDRQVLKATGGPVASWSTCTE